MIMDIAGGVKTIAAVAVGLGTVGGSAIVLDSRHYPMSSGMAMEASQHVQVIQNWLRAARTEGPTPTICGAIRAELGELCTEQPNHYLCSVESRRELLKDAGCT